jgi:hypothetical protein
MKVNYTVSAGDRGSFNESAEAVFLVSSVDEETTNVIIAGETNLADAVCCLSRLVADVAKSFGKGLEFASLVNTGANLILVVGDFDGEEKSPTKDGGDE